MKIGDITDAFVQKTLDTIFEEWKHEGHIDFHHTEAFRCVIDGRLYEITVREVKQ